MWLTAQTGDEGVRNLGERLRGVWTSRPRVEKRCERNGATRDDEQEGVRFVHPERIVQRVSGDENDKSETCSDQSQERHRRTPSSRERRGEHRNGVAQLEPAQ